VLLRNRTIGAAATSLGKKAESCGTFGMVSGQKDLTGETK
jgi:hypothetical protein